jgi:hypothetical protein
VGFILDDEVRRLVEEAEDAMDDEQTHTLLEGLVDPAATGQKVRAAADAIGARVRDLYAGRAGAVPAPSAPRPVPGRPPSDPRPGEG